MRRTIAMGPSRCEWTCGAGAIRAFFDPVYVDPQQPLRIGDITGTGPVVVVTDENVDRLHSLALPRNLPRIVVPAGEASKSFANLARVLRMMLEAGLDRSGTVIAFGGGVVGDLTGFAAATFMRGVSWINVPTTLLAMVDASIGGKTAVDVNGVKNLAGAFHVPTAVVADPSVLETLPAAERSAGMAEVVKQAVVGSRELFERLEKGVFDDAGDLARAVQVKIDIVERDPLERGERAVLNLGHTIGHGIEAASSYAIAHGAAVAVGLVAEARIAGRVGLADAGLADRVASVLERFGLPTSAPLQPEAVRAAMSADKKRSGGRLRFALPRAVGDVTWGVEVEERVVMEAVGQACR